MSRRIVLKQEAIQKRKMVEIEADMHDKIAELSYRSGLTIREIVETLLEDALKYVEVEKLNNGKRKEKPKDRNIVAKNEKEYQHCYYLTVTKPKRQAKKGK